jgi:broad specificity phosphatase PhoE
MLEEEGVLTIHLVRHGETLASREHRLCGQSDCAHDCDHPGITAAPGGESGFQVAARALPAIERIRGAHEVGDVLVVSHEATIRIITCALLGISVDLYRARLALPVASFTTVEFRSTGPLLGRSGDAVRGTA